MGYDAKIIAVGCFAMVLDIPNWGFDAKIIAVGCFVRVLDIPNGVTIPSYLGLGQP